MRRIRKAVTAVEVYKFYVQVLKYYHQHPTYASHTLVSPLWLCANFDINIKLFLIREQQQSFVQFT
jgi:hypothetical protein